MLPPFESIGGDAMRFPDQAGGVGGGVGGAAAGGCAWGFSRRDGDDAGDALPSLSSWPTDRRLAPPVPSVYQGGRPSGGGGAVDPLLLCDESSIMAVRVFGKAIENNLGTQNVTELRIHLSSASTRFLLTLPKKDVEGLWRETTNKKWQT